MAALCIDHAAAGECVPINILGRKEYQKAMERSLIILKPDAVQRGLCGEILTRFEKKGLQVVGMKLMRISKELAEAIAREYLDCGRAVVVVQVSDGHIWKLRPRRK